MLEAAAAVPGRPALLGVTVLTSLDAADLADLGIAAKPDEQALRLGRLAMAAGLDGVVCSPLEIASLRRALGPATEDRRARHPPGRDRRRPEARHGAGRGLGAGCGPAGDRPADHPRADSGRGCAPTRARAAVGGVTWRPGQDLRADRARARRAGAAARRRLSRLRLLSALAARPRSGARPRTAGGRAGRRPRPWVSSSTPPTTRSRPCSRPCRSICSSFTATRPRSAWPRSGSASAAA